MMPAGSSTGCGLGRYFIRSAGPAKSCHTEVGSAPRSRSVSVVLQRDTLEAGLRSASGLNDI